MKFSLTHLSATPPSPENCEVVVEMAITVVAKVRANSERQAVEDVAAQLTKLDIDGGSVWGPCVSPVGEGQLEVKMGVGNKEYTVTVSAEDYLTGQLAAAVTAIFTAASDTDQTSETRALVK